MLRGSRGLKDLRGLRSLRGNSFRANRIKSRSNFASFFPSVLKQLPAVINLLFLPKPAPRHDFASCSFFKGIRIYNKQNKNSVVLKESPPCRVFGLVKPIEIGGHAHIHVKENAYVFLLAESGATLFKRVGSTNTEDHQQRREIQIFFNETKAIFCFTQEKHTRENKGIPGCSQPKATLFPLLHYSRYSCKQKSFIHSHLLFYQVVRHQSCRQEKMLWPHFLFCNSQNSAAI